RVFHRAGEGRAKCGDAVGRRFVDGERPAELGAGHQKLDELAVLVGGRGARWVTHTRRSRSWRSSGVRAASSTEGASRSGARGPAWAITVIFFSLSQSALVAFQLDQVLFRASPSPRSIARLIWLPPV